MCDRGSCVCVCSSQQANPPDRPKQVQIVGSHQNGLSTKAQPMMGDCQCTLYRAPGNMGLSPNKLKDVLLCTLQPPQKREGKNKYTHGLSLAYGFEGMQTSPKRNGETQLKLVHNTTLDLVSKGNVRLFWLEEKFGAWPFSSSPNLQAFNIVRCSHVPKYQQMVVGPKQVNLRAFRRKAIQPMQGTCNLNSSAMHSHSI